MVRLLSKFLRRRFSRSDILRYIFICGPRRHNVPLIEYVLYATQGKQMIVFCHGIFGLSENLRILARKISLELLESGMVYLVYGIGSTQINT